MKIRLRISILTEHHRFICEVWYSLMVTLEQLKNCATEREYDFNSCFLEDKSFQGKAE